MQIEVNAEFVPASTEFRTPSGNTVSITPPLRAEYFIARVPLHADQAIVIFPKFFTVGCGFAIEDADWNTNLPLSQEAETIVDHIWENRKYDCITREQCIEAVRMLQDWNKERG